MFSRWYSANTSAYHAPPPKLSTSKPIPRPDEEQEIRTESQSVESPSTQAPISEPIGPTPTTTPIPEREKKVSFPESSELELAMIRDIVENPFDGVVKRIHRLQTSRRKGSAALKALEERGLVASANLFTGTSVVKLFDLTQAGRALCHAKGIGLLPDITRGGIEHRYWVAATAEKLREQGWQATCEYKVSDELTVDIHAEKGGRLLAVLVETGKSDIKKNIATATSNSYTEIWIVATNPKVRATINNLRTTYPNIVCLAPGQAFPKPVVPATADQDS
jgi:hypothetical protein